MVSEVAIGGMVAGGVTVLNLGFNLLMARKAAGDRRAERSEDHREWYRRTLFEKRVLASQEAHVWLHKLGHSANRIDWNNPTADTNAELRRVSKDAREWYDLNALLLHNEIPESASFVAVCNSALELSLGEKKSVFWEVLRAADEENRTRADALMLSERDGHRE